MLTTVFLLTTSMVLGQVESGANKPAAETSPQLRPKAVLDYFAGDWLGRGMYGDVGPLNLRVRAEWDLNHTVMVERIEWTTGAGVSLVVKKWDAASNRLVVRVFMSNWSYLDMDLQLEPHGKFFKLTGTTKGSEGNQPVSEETALIVDDENNYTWTATNRMRGDKKQPDWVEKYRRVGTFPTMQSSDPGKPDKPTKPDKPKKKRNKAEPGNE